MKTAYTFCAISLGVICLASCSHKTYGLDNSYKECPPQGATRPLPDGKTPLVIYTMEPEALTKRYEATGYVVIGMAETVQTLIPYGAVAAFAESKNASVVITDYRFERVDNETHVRPVTEKYSTYHEGNIAPTNNYYSIGANGLLTTPTSYSYSGSSTTYHTRMQEYTVPVTKYSQCFYFLAPKA